MIERFPQHVRLKTPDEFSKVLNHNTGRVHADPFFVLYCQNTYSHPRIGLAIAKKLVNKASGRNRVKRVIRESFRKKKDVLGSVDIVILGRAGIASAGNAELRDSLDKIWRKLQKQCKKS